MTWSNPKTILSLILIIGIIGLGIVSILREKIVHPVQNQISVSATGEVFAKPDIASLSFGVHTALKKEPALAVKTGAEQMNKIIKALKEVEIAEKDIQTTQYKLNPVYQKQPRPRLDILDFKPNRKIIGYELNQSIKVKVRNLNDLGKIIKVATLAGANQIGQIGFTIDSKDKLEAKAREQAITKAKQKAKEIEKAAGIRLGKIINVYENNYNYAENYSMQTKTMAVDKGVEVPVPQIQSGQTKISVKVTLTYQIK